MAPRKKTPSSVLPTPRKTPARRTPGRPRRDATDETMAAKQTAEMTAPSRSGPATKKPRATQSSAKKTPGNSGLLAANTRGRGRSQPLGTEGDRSESESDAQIIGDPDQELVQQIKDDCRKRFIHPCWKRIRNLTDRPPLPPRPPKAKPDPAEGEDYDIEGDHGLMDQREDRRPGGVAAYKNGYDKIKQNMEEVQDWILNLVDQYFGQEPVRDVAVWLRDLMPGDLGSANQKHKYPRLSPEFIRYAGFIAVGGPAGVAGWEQLFVDPTYRKALAAGVIWLAIKQHVFNEPWFGAEESAREALEERERKWAKSFDGFGRSQDRMSYLRDDEEALPLRACLQRQRPPAYCEAITELADRIYATIAPARAKPISSLARDKEGSTITLLLRDIIDAAAQISYTCKLDGDAVYVFANSPKDYGYDAIRNRFFSLEHYDYITLHGRAEDTPEDRQHGLIGTKWERVKNYSLLNRVIVFDALEAYRSGGWRKSDKQRGYRRQLLAKGMVCVRWGAVRQFTPTSNGFSQGCFVELRDCAPGPCNGQFCLLVDPKRGPCKDGKDCAKVDKRGKFGGNGKWWEESGGEPAFGTYAWNVPVLGKGRWQQKDLSGFEPNWYSHF